MFQRLVRHSDDCNNPLDLSTGIETCTGLCRDWAGESHQRILHTFHAWFQAGVFTSSNSQPPSGLFRPAYRKKYFIQLISANNPSNMTKPGILVFLLLFGGCFPFVFSRRKRQRARDAKTNRGQGRGSKDGSAPLKVSTDQTPYKPQESSVSLPKKPKKPTWSYASRAAHFSGPQNLSEEDKFWQQAYHYGAR